MKDAMWGRTSSLALIAALFSGCAAAPRETAQTSGALPAQARFGFASFDAGEPDALRDRIGACLVAHGLTQAADPAYLVQIAFSDHPARTQAIDPAQPAPAKRGGKRHNVTLVVTLSEVSSGREVWRVNATRRGEATGAALADAACAALNPAAG